MCRKLMVKSHDPELCSPGETTGSHRSFSSRAQRNSCWKFGGYRCLQYLDLVWGKLVFLDRSKSGFLYRLTQDSPKFIPSSVSLGGVLHDVAESWKLAIVRAKEMQSGWNFQPRPADMNNRDQPRESWTKWWKILHVTTSYSLHHQGFPLWVAGSQISIHSGSF